MFKKEYIYHVTYSFKHGVGRLTMYRNKKIDTVEDVRSVEKYIEDEHGLENVFLTNWIRLKK